MIIRNLAGFRAKRYLSFTNANIVVDGNSLSTSAGSGIAWPAKLSALPPFNSNGAAVTNLAVSGQNTRNMLTDAATQIDPLYDDQKANILIAWEIRNDIVAGQTIQQALDNFQQYCTERREAGFYVVVLTLTPSWRDDYQIGGEAGYNQLEADRLSINTSLRENHKDYSDLLIDIGDHPLLGQTGANEPSGWQFSDGRMGATTLYTDGTHFSDAGKDLIASMVMGKLLGMPVRNPLVGVPTDLLVTSSMLQFSNPLGYAQGVDRATLFDGITDNNVPISYKDFYDEPRFSGDVEGAEYLLWLGGNFVLTSVKWYHVGDNNVGYIQLANSPYDTNFSTELTIDSTGFNNEETTHVTTGNPSGKWVRLRIKHRNLKLPDYITLSGYYTETVDFSRPTPTDNYTLPKIKDFVGHCTFMGNAVASTTIDNVTRLLRVYNDGNNFSTENDYWPNNTFGHEDSNSYNLLLQWGTDGFHKVCMNLKAGFKQLHHNYNYTTPQTSQAFLAAAGNLIVTHNVGNLEYGVRALLSDGTRILPDTPIVKTATQATFPLPTAYDGQDITIEVSTDFGGSSRPFDNDRLDGYGAENYKMFADACYHYAAIYGGGGGDINEANKATQLKLTDPTQAVNLDILDSFMIINEPFKDWYGRRSYYYIEELVALMKSCYDEVKRAAPGLRVVLGPSHGHFPQAIELMHIVALD